MAKLYNSLNFKCAEISLDDNTITEITKDGEIVHNLSDVIALFKDKSMDITFEEAKDVVFNDEE
ncbi:YonK family protein [Neobacillus sp. YIM B02564]|uniref:YonK family protein n=1 Tax=Neobacillus paridis TaxID=2803862 RepID=A0ABS1TJS5_9BACI|nr:YonK family protein [Neobacillus paridis]MBL4950999.1 YonK family protein [Neobacillus paridis]